MKRVFLKIFLLFMCLVTFPHHTYLQDMAPPTPDAASSAPPPPAPTSEIKNEQLTWPDTVEFTEAQQGLAGLNNPAITAAFKRAKETVEKLAGSLEQIIKTRDDLYKLYFELSDSLNDFLQNSSSSEGSLQETFASLAPKKNM
jgi:hypothetical protein